MPCRLDDHYYIMGGEIVMRTWKKALTLTMILVLVALGSISSTSFTSQPSDETVNIENINLDHLDAPVKEMNNDTKQVMDYERILDLEHEAKTAISKEMVDVHNNAQLNRSEEHTSELQSRFDLVCRL